MNVAALLARSARRAPGAPAVLHGERLLHDYASLASRSARLATALRDRLGVAPGDRVALWTENCVEYLEILHAAWWVGAVAVPVNAKLHPQELAWILGHCGARLLFAGARSSPPQVDGVRVVAIGDARYEALLAGAPAALADRGPDDAAWLFYTSGTTGRPKGATLTHRNLLAMTACYFTDVDAADARDASVYGAPMSHGAGLYALPYLLKGARHAVPESGGFDAAELLALSRGLGRVAMFAAPTMVRRLVDAAARGADPRGLRTVVYGGAPMYVEDIRDALDAIGDRFVQIYGQGESPMTITALAREVIADRAHPRWLERLGSVGTAQSLVQVRVADPDGRPLPEGETGEVLVRGDTVMAGYWQDAEATARAIRGGWLWTGDLGALDGDGFLVLKDRSKDMVISGGSNVYPREVEEVLLVHPDVREVSVVGTPDPEWGEAVVAFVVAAEGAAGDALRASLDALCLERIARYKRPRRYEFVEALPKNNYGKVLKTELRARLAAR